jgi:hypothetical protein
VTTQHNTTLLEPAALMEPVFDAITQGRVFEGIHLSALDKATPSRIHTLPGVKQLVRLFDSARLESKLSFNQGTCEISLVLEIKDWFVLPCYFFLFLRSELL